MSTQKDILNRITDADVKEWLLARLESLREESGLPIHDLTFKAVKYKKSNVSGFSVTMHCSGECVISYPDIATAVKELKELVGDVQTLAKEKRERAKRLMEEADELEGAGL